MRNIIVCILLTATAVAQENPDAQRTKDIQRALRSAGYTHVIRDGLWTDNTVQALKQIAKDNHWQTQSVPDARVLQWLGLGADYKNLLNPDTAQIAEKVNHGTVKQSIHDNRGTLTASSKRTDGVVQATQSDRVQVLRGTFIARRR